MLMSTKTIAAFLIFAGVGAGCGTSVKHNDADSRALPGGRELVITVAQSQIGADVDQSHTAAQLGLIGGLLEAGLNSARESSVKKDIEPVRAALQGYAFDKVAQSAVVAALSPIKGLSVSRVTFSGDGSLLTPESIDARLRSAKTQEVIFVNLRYALTYRFRGVLTEWQVLVLPKETPPGSWTMQTLSKKASFEQTVSCVVPLDKSSPDLEINRPIWVADGGKAIKDGVDACLGKLNYLVKRDLNMGPEERAKLKAGKLIDDRVHRVKGSIIENAADSTLILGKLDTPFYRWILLMKPAALKGKPSQ